MSTTGNVDITRYTYRVTWSAEDEEYVATCLELPSLSWLAESQDEALRELRELIADAIQTCATTRNRYPSPCRPGPTPASSTCASEMHLHRKLAMEAAEEHLSLNQYVVRRLTNAS